MEKKYLPIGTICTLKGKNKKVMITGYYTIEFNGNIKVNDYCGCVYPEGEMLSEQKCNFNHTDIEKIDFLGYRDDESYRFHRLLDKAVGNEKDEVEEASEFHNKNDMVLTSNSSYSKLLFDENGVVMIAEPVKTDVKENEKKDFGIKFSEDGTVLNMDEEDEIENPFKKNYKTYTPKEEDSSEWNIFDKKEYDEEEIEIKPENSSLNKIEFDENGVVVSVTAESLKNNQYTFDKDGTLIAVNGEY